MATKFSFLKRAAHEADDDDDDDVVAAADGVMMALAPHGHL